MCDNDLSGIHRNGCDAITALWRGTTVETTRRMTQPPRPHRQQQQQQQQYDLPNDVASSSPLTTFYPTSFVFALPCRRMSTIKHLDIWAFKTHGGPLVSATPSKTHKDPMIILPKGSCRGVPRLVFGGMSIALIFMSICGWKVKWVERVGPFMWPRH